MPSDENARCLHVIVVHDRWGKIDVSSLTHWTFCGHCSLFVRVEPMTRYLQRSEDVQHAEFKVYHANAFEKGCTQ